jgi:hypothetical protein
MPLEEMRVQHSIWEAHYQRDHSDHRNPLELSTESRMWLLVVFVLVSFACMGYVLWIVMEREKREQKKKELKELLF